VGDERQGWVVAVPPVEDAVDDERRGPEPWSLQHLLGGAGQLDRGTGVQQHVDVVTLDPDGDAGERWLELPVRSAQETERCAVGRRVDVDLEAPTPVVERPQPPAEPPRVDDSVGVGLHRHQPRETGGGHRWIQWQPDADRALCPVRAGTRSNDETSSGSTWYPRPVTGRREADGITSRRERVSRVSIPEWGQA
jgi:hypothetical protein